MSLSAVTTSGGYRTNSGTDNQLSVGYLDNRYLALDGSKTMSGTLKVGGFSITGVSTPVNSTDGVNKLYTDNLVANIKIQDKHGLIPILQSNTPSSGWIMYASSEYSGTLSAYKVTQQDNSSYWASAVTTNFYIGVQIPNFISAVEPYGFSVRGRLNTSEYLTNWIFRVSIDGITFVTLYSSTVPIGSTILYYP